MLEYIAFVCQLQFLGAMYIVQEILRKKTQPLNTNYNLVMEGLLCTFTYLTTNQFLP